VLTRVRGVNYRSESQPESNCPQVPKASPEKQVLLPQRFLCLTEA